MTSAFSIRFRLSVAIFDSSEDVSCLSATMLAPFLTINTVLPDGAIFRFIEMLLSFIGAERRRQLPLRQLGRRAGDKFKYSQSVVV
jgi:hypothetical protein